MNNPLSELEDEKKDECEPNVGSNMKRKASDESNSKATTNTTTTTTVPATTPNIYQQNNGSSSSNIESSTTSPTSSQQQQRQQQERSVDHDGTNGSTSSSHPNSSRSYNNKNHHHHRKPSSLGITVLTWILRTVVIDIPLMVLFIGLVSSILFHRIQEEYLYPQVRLMQFAGAGRGFTDTTYYHRACDEQDVSAKSVQELVIPTHYTTQNATDHMLRHGVSVYQNLLSKDTATELRDWIEKENKVQEGWYVIKNQHRYSWGIDMNMHPALQTFWNELLAHPQLLDSLQSIVGPDPAIIEFTAITAAYGAQDQHDHSDVVPPGSAAKYARSFIPSYSLFVPLQDTTYEMGATHVCPGTHLCSTGCSTFCPKGNNIAMSGPPQEGGIWPMGWGALMNQQTTHKGMGYTQKGGIDRVVLIATFAPRPQTARTVETRMIGLGGSYSLIWHQWGHTLYDYVHADTRMTEPQKTLRSLGLLKSNGWDLPSVTSMRIANEEYSVDKLDSFIKKRPWFLPQSWYFSAEGEDKGGDDEDEAEGNASDDDEDNDNMMAWRTFLIGIVERAEKDFKRLNLVVIVGYLVVLVIFDVMSLFLQKKKWSFGRSVTIRGIGRILVTHGFILWVAWLTMRHIDETNWAKSIKAGKAYRIPLSPPKEVHPKGTIPYRTDILVAPQYVSSLLGQYSKVLDFAHPGNRHWKEVVYEYDEGYMALTPELQMVFCSSLVRWMESERRFLIQDAERYWYRIHDDKELQRFCDRELSFSADPLKETIFRAVGELKSEIEYGRWRGMTIYNTTSPTYLNHIEDLLYPGKKPLINNKSSSRGHKARHLSIGSYLKATPQIISHQRKFSIPSLPVVPAEPVVGAWLQESDIVEVKYKCKYNEWYKATIIAANPSKATYEVFYADGETDSNVARKCLRLFVPYKVGDSVEVRVEGDDETYLRGEIVAILPVDGSDDDHFDVETDHGILSLVTADRLRRFKQVDHQPFKVGSRVMAPFEGDDEEEFFPATIRVMYSDGSAAVLFDDGDYVRLDLELVVPL